MAFFQEPPRLDNGYLSDRVLRSYLQRTMGEGPLAEITGQLEHMGELASGELLALQHADRRHEPRLTQWDAWGKRIDHIELTAVWKRAREIACQQGLIATAYEQRHGALSRIHQFAMVYLFEGCSDVYTCPLAMSDGAARTLLTHRHPVLTERAVPRLTSRDAVSAWTSGQWMTERTGGSDVGASETLAHACADGGRAYGCDDVYQLHGSKWFTSAVTSEMALTLARTEAGASGGRGLTLFYLETKKDDGSSNQILVNRLKDKLGTRKLPTGELTLSGSLAVPVAGLGRGIRQIAPMLNITRTWNAVCSVGAMRHGLALARDYATRRAQFGKTLAKQPLHVDTLAGLQAEYEAAFHLAFWTVELLGRQEASTASEADLRLLRLLTPLAKLVTAKQCVTVMSEIIECFGGAGYVEDTGIPRLLRDAQVLPIWEGTTNVLSLDVLRAIGEQRDLPALGEALDKLHAEVRSGALREVVAHAQQAFSHVKSALGSATPGDQEEQRGARRLALTLGRSVAASLLARHAQWCLDEQNDARPAWAAARFSSHGLDQISPMGDASQAAGLGMDVLA
jgi:alkylation response protein AidB-like acyl-CoA dehydrogenase